MATSQFSDDQFSDLRRKAEDMVASRTVEDAAFDERTLNRLIREVRAAQVELERKNKALVETRKLVEAARERNARLYEKYANLFDFAPNGYLVLDQEGAVQDANQTAAVMLNLPRGKLTGRCMSDFFHNDDHDAFQLLQQKCRERADVRIADLAMVCHGGRRFTAQVQLQAFADTAGRGIEFRMALTDISEKVRVARNLSVLQNIVAVAGRATSSEQLLRENVQQIKSYVGCDAVGIRVRDAEGNIPYHAYEGFSRGFYESESPLSLHTDQCMCAEVIKGRSDARQAYFTSKGSFYINGTSRFLAGVPPEQLDKTRNACNAHGYESVALIPITISETIMGMIHVADRRENQVPLWVVEMLESVGLRIGLALQRFHMQDRLRDSFRELRELSSHLLKIQEDEQRRIAMELHDQTGQDLNVLKLRISAIRNKLRKDQPGLKASCAQILTYTDKIINDVRRLAHGLNPAALEALGLGGALRQMVRELTQYSQLKIKTRIAPLERIADRDIQTGLFRIIQETLSNVYKHARATEVTINAIHTVKGLQIVVRDNGKGFQVKSVKSGEKSMGLATMRLRARMIGARLTIRSRPDHGTRVKIILSGLKRNMQDFPFDAPATEKR